MPRAPADPASGSIEEAGLGLREQQVQEFLVAGPSCKEIATEVNIKTSTVGTCVQRIYEKIHVCSRRAVISLVRCGGDALRG